jgi:hypothetical protein
MATRIQVVFAAKDPGRLAAFWREALDYAAEPPPAGFASWEEFAAANNIQLEAGTDIDSAVDPDGVGPRFLFEREDPKARGGVHLDVNAGTGRPLGERKKIVDEEVHRLIRAGATRMRVVDNDDNYWIELTDPEGNWFCVQ